ncbi:MAG: DUF433 domain-containing protein [Bacteroidetes bacterium]|nr:MAG: DUF433 domain-containing protein [Bacteroidota bacterium]
MKTISFKDHIGIDPAIRFGKPCIIGTRISVYDILGWLSMDMSFEEIITDFPQLKRESILACLAYAAQKNYTRKLLIF